MPRPAGAVFGACIRDKGRRGGRRLRAGGAHGGHQSAFYGRSARDYGGEQSPVRVDGQSYFPRKRLKHRYGQYLFPPLYGHERPRADQHYDRRQGTGRRAGGPLRYHGGERGDGGAVPGDRSRRSQKASGEYHRRAEQGRGVRAGKGHSRGGRLDGGAVKGRHEAESGADPRGYARDYSRRPVRQYRARLQQRSGHVRGHEPRRLRGDGSGVRRGSGRGKIPRHQVPRGGHRAGLRRDRGHRQGLEAARRRREGAVVRGGPRRAGKGHAQPPEAYRKYQKRL